METEDGYTIHPLLSEIGTISEAISDKWEKMPPHQKAYLVEIGILLALTGLDILTSLPSIHQNIEFEANPIGRELSHQGGDLYLILPKAFTILALVANHAVKNITRIIAEYSDYPNPRLDIILDKIGLNTLRVVNIICSLIVLDNAIVLLMI